ncbi:MAG: J domain-containing protein [Actinomycetota bacterium]|nr:J domain-containing protein [Actinomycetota bacterium]
MTVKRDAYEVLGISRDADEREIKRSFRKLARELHPDVNRHDHDAEERFKEAADAYEILSDPERRQVYNRYGHDGLSSQGREPNFAGFGSVSDIFDAFFGGGDAFGGGGRRSAGVQGGDVAVAAEISLAEAARGNAVGVEYEVVAPCERCQGNAAEPGTPIETCARCGGSGELRTAMRSAFGQVIRAHLCDACGGDGKIARTPCTRCRGRGREARRAELEVDVPAGIANDQRIRLSGRGHAGEGGGAPGDLYVVVRVAEDERFVRDGNDLVSVVDVSAPAAALGTSLSVPTLDGEETIELEPGTQPGSVVNLPGLGMPSVRRGRRGDQRVVVNVVVPRELSTRQRSLLEELEGSLEERNLRPPAERAHESLFARVRRALG